LEKLIRAMLRRRRLIPWIAVALVLCSLVLVPLVSINYDLRRYLPADSPTLTATRLMDETFGLKGTASVMTGPGAIAHPGHGVGDGVAVHDVVLFEPLVRAAVRDRAAVKRVAVMVEELRGGPKSLLPEGFDELWAVVREVVMAEGQP